MCYISQVEIFMFTKMCSFLHASDLMLCIITSENQVKAVPIIGSDVSLVSSPSFGEAVGGDEGIVMSGWTSKIAACFFVEPLKSTSICVTCSSSLKSIWHITYKSIVTKQICRRYSPKSLSQLYTHIKQSFVQQWLFVQFTCYTSIGYWPIYSHHKKARFPPLKLSHQTSFQAIFEVAYSATPRLRRRSWTGEISTSFTLMRSNDFHEAFVVDETMEGALDFLHFC